MQDIYLFVFTKQPDNSCQRVFGYE